MDISPDCQFYLRSVNLVKIYRNRDEKGKIKVLECLRKHKKQILECLPLIIVGMQSEILKQLAEEVFNSALLNFDKAVTNGQFEVKISQQTKEPIDTCVPYFKRILKNEHHDQLPKEIKFFSIREVLTGSLKTASDNDALQKIMPEDTPLLDFLKKKLSENDWTFVKDFFIDSLTSKEMAEKYKIGIDAVYNRKSRIMTRILQLQGFFKILDKKN